MTSAPQPVAAADAGREADRHLDADRELDVVVRAVLDELDGLDSLPQGDTLADLVREAVDSRLPLLGASERARVAATVIARRSGYGPLEPLLADPDVTDVLVNPDGSVWIERAGKLQRTGICVDEELRSALIERIVIPLGLRIDRTHPVVDARLPDGSRVHAVVRPLALDGPCLSIRRFGTRRRPLDDFAPPATVALLRAAVAHRLNVVVSGGTGAGKTSLLNAIAAELPPEARVVTIEDAAELSLPGTHVVRLEARPPNAEGVGEVRIRDLVRAALRMRPDRIVVGEVRGPEALDMLQAMNTGHEGSLSTCHANSPADALRRLETMILMGDTALPSAAVREQLRSSLDLIVQVARQPGRAARRIVAVDEVVDEVVDGLTDMEVDPAPGAGRGMATRRLCDASGGAPARSGRPSRREPGAPWWP